MTAATQAMITNAMRGRTAQGEPATRGHITAEPDWPRCATVLPTIVSPIFQTRPNLCNRPASLLARLSANYLDACAAHRCDDPHCPIPAMGTDPRVREEQRSAAIPVCGMHIGKMLADADRFRRDVMDIDAVFDLWVIGVESRVGNAAEMIDLRGGGEGWPQ